jgi:Domain of unknown function (DUF5666)
MNRTTADALTEGFCTEISPHYVLLSDGSWRCIPGNAGKILAAGAGSNCKAMNRPTLQEPRSLRREKALLSLIMPFLAASLLSAQQAAPAPRVLGTVQSINGKSLTVLSDAGVVSAVSIEDATKLLQIEPGKTDLKEATPLALSDLQPGDRVLVRGLMADDGKTLRAASLIAMKKAAISEKQNKERAEWQHGVAGLVKFVDPAAQTVVLTTNGLSSHPEIVLQLSKDTVLRRYAPDSTRFDAAKPAPLSAVQTGDQLRARGSRSADGGSFDAAEIVSGTFRNIAGTVSSIDAGSNSVVVQDLATKSAITLKIAAESQMRKLPAQFAERLAARLKGQSPEAPAAQGGAAVAPGQRQQAQPSDQSAASGTGNRASGGDFQQMLARMPAATLVDLQKGDAVMVVSTQGTDKDAPVVVTLLAGVEAILRASPKGGQDMILSPWTLGGGEPSGN